MKFLIVGAGAIGGYVGGSLALAGHEVTFIARPAAAAALAASGLSITQARGGETRTTRDFTVAGSLAAALAGAGYDCLVLAIKAYDVEAFAQELRSVASAPPPILSLQNGVAAEGQLAAALGANSVIAGSVA